MQLPAGFAVDVAEVRPPVALANGLVITTML